MVKYTLLTLLRHYSGVYCQLINRLAGGIQWFYGDLKSLNLLLVLVVCWVVLGIFSQNFDAVGKDESGNIPPAQAASKSVPFKDWNDIIIPNGSSA